MTPPTTNELKKLYKKYSYLDLDPKQFSQAAQAPQPQSTGVLNSQQEQTAQRVLVKDFQQKWGKIDRQFAEITPMGAIANAGNMTHSKYIALQNAWNTTIQYFAQTSGSEYLGAYIMAMGLNDDTQRQSTLAALTSIINGGTVSEAPSTTDILNQRAHIDNTGMPLTPELFMKTVADTSTFKELSYRQQQEFIQHAQEVVQEYARRGHQFDAIQRSVSAIATGDLTQALTPQEAAELQNAVKNPKYTEPGSMALQLGPHATLEREGSQIVIDPDWARAHPAKASAEAFYLQQQFPQGQVVFGRGGIASELINAVGKPIDVIASVPSAVIALTEGKIRQVFDNGDPDEMRAQRDELSKALATAPLSEREDILHTIDKLNDRIGAIETGGTQGFQDLVDHALNSEQANLGFSENIVQGAGLLPGDKGYEASIGVTMVVGSVLFDPIMWTAGIAEGAKAAATIPKVEGVGMEGAKAVRGVIARFVYNRMALTPEEFLDSAYAMGAIDHLAEAAKGMSPEIYSYYLQQHGLSASQRLLIESAGSDPVALRDAFHAIIGGYEEGTNVKLLSQKISELGARLNEREVLAAEARDIQSVMDGTYDARVTQLETHIEDMDVNGLTGTPEYQAAQDELERLKANGPERAIKGTMTSGLARLDELNSTVVADKAEMAHLKSVRRGAVYSVGKPFDFGDFRVLEQSSNAWNKAVAALDDGLREFPKGFIPEEVSTRLGGSAKRLFSALAVAFRPSGLEGAEAVADGMRRALWLPGVTAPDGALIDLFERSREALTNVGRLLEVPEESIAEQMGQWDRLVAANNADESFHWLTKTWERYILESPRVQPAMKANLMRLWDTPFEQWGSDVIRTSAPGEYVVHEPVMYKTITDPATGELLKAGQPIVSADYLSGGVFLPDLNKVIEAISPKLSRVLQGRGVTGVTSVWKRVILTSRLPFALPARIVGELLFARMSAFDLASLGNWGVLDWMRSVRGAGEFERFATDPAFALGGLLDTYEGAGRLANRASQLGILNSTAGEDYYRAVSGRLAHLAANASPEARVILDSGTPEAFLMALHSPDAPEALKVAANHWAQGEGGLDVVATRVWDYYHNVIPGTGDFAEEIRTALKTGKLSDGTEVGTIEFANRLQEESVGGRWIPGMSEVHGKYAVGLNYMVDRAAVTKANDWLMKWFYSKPEANLGRIPAYRQRAAALYERLRAMNYPENVATEVSRAAAARDTANTFFRIGAHTYGEAMVRNISPFFPAWREVTDTWLLRAPQRIGGGSRVIGGLYLANRTRMMFEVGRHLGVISTAPDGSFRLNLPFLNPIFNLFLGPGHQVSASFDSLFGILPFPKLDATSWTDAVGSMLPSLGGAAIPVQMLALKSLDRAHPGWQRDLADLIAPFGVGNVGGNWSNMYTAFALQHGMDPIPPWEKFTNGDFKEAMVNLAIDDGMRYLVSSGDPKYQPPLGSAYDLTTKEGTQQFAADYKKWQETLITDAEHYAGASMMTRSILSTIFPVSAKPTTKEQDSITAIWGFLNGDHLPPDVKDAAMSPLLEAFKTAYPEADWYTIGKTDSLAMRGHHQEETTDADIEALFSEGLLKVRTPEEYTVWAAGIGSYSTYIARRNAVYAQFDNNPVEYLLNGDAARAKIAEISGNWQLYLDAQEQTAQKEGLPSFKEMLSRSHATKIMAASDHALQGLTHMLPLVQENVENMDPTDFAKFRANLYDSISNAALNATTQGERNMFTTMGKWYKQVSDPYYEHLNELYDKVNKLPDGSPGQQALYDEIRRYSNDQRAARVGGVKFPTPEEVSFFTKTPDEQAAWAAKRLSYGHPEWLTEFQQRALNLGGGKKANDFTDWVSEQEMAFKQRYPLYTMSGYSDARDRLDRAEGAEAKARGLGDLWQRWQQPLYRKLDSAGLGSGPGWSAAVQFADQAVKSITSRGYVSGSTSPNASSDQRWLFDKLNTLYQSDSTFKDTVDTIAVGLGDENGPVPRQQVFWNVFLDGYGSPPPNLY